MWRQAAHLEEVGKASGPDFWNAWLRWATAPTIRRRSSGASSSERRPRGLRSGGRMKLHWNDLGTARADLADGEWVEITGWPSTALPATSADYFHLTAEPNCCVGCLPANPLAVVEVFAKRQIEFPMGARRMVARLADRIGAALGCRAEP